MKDWVLEFVRTNRGKVAGGAIGLLIAILIFTINFWRTLLLFLLIGVGVYLGSHADGGGRLQEIVDRIFKGKTR